MRKSQPKLTRHGQDSGIPNPNSHLRRNCLTRVFNTKNYKRA